MEHSAFLYFVTKFSLPLFRPFSFVSHAFRSHYIARDPYETCPICLEDYKERDKIRLLPCHHAFHNRCIDPWLLRNRRRCPVCNQTVELPGAPSPEDVVLAGHEPIPRASFLTRLRRIRFLFPSRNGAHRDRTDWASSAESSLVSATNPQLMEQDEERAPLLEQQISPQGSRYSANLAYSAHLVSSDEALEQTALLDVAINPGTSATQTHDDDELLRLHPDNYNTIVKVSLPVPADVAINERSPYPTPEGDNLNAAVADDDQLLSVVVEPTTTWKK
ncbi:unnamed protein product [Echinostoma caproni]|uniref:RING-type domain-containing protein n=1 Tax=Echinostoma caproni TaxID=27848 RepID=A0A183A6K8_9TREM|nr:unnamed protein product [Echinostoma caproni]